MNKITIDVKRLTEVKQYAESNPIDIIEVAAIEVAAKILNNKFDINKNRDMSNHKFTVPPAFVGTYTNEVHPTGTIRHLSVGINDKKVQELLTYPPIELIMDLCKLLGFITPINECVMTDSPTNVGAINIFDPIDGDWSNHPEINDIRKISVGNLIVKIEELINGKCSSCESKDICKDTDSDEIILNAKSFLQKVYNYNSSYKPGLEDYIGSVEKSIKHFEESNKNLGNSLKSGKVTIH